MSATLAGPHPVVLAMFAASRIAVSHHREALAVLISSALFLAAALALALMSS